jgi:hypothetical protein
VKSISVSEVIKPHGDADACSWKEPRRRASHCEAKVGVEWMISVFDLPRRDRRHRLAEHGKSFRHLRRQPLAGVRQADLARAAQEKRLADILFQQLHLIADGRLRHAELFAGPGEAAEPGDGLEDAQAFSGNCFDSFMDKFSLCIQTVVRLELQHFIPQTASQDQRLSR